ncbi:NifB/NifX family molybdenum-iron cluster-binding protein [Beggiatoa leptomitoformis]|nr:NifB/NifX family molybdenum-iron cluster-binding protein [Beggiatoa leptomitoformis]
MDTSAIQVAFASTDMKTVNQHFGSSESFVIYSVTATSATLREAAQFQAYAQDGNEDKLAEKFKLLEGCAAVYCQAIGGSAIRQLTVQGIQPVKVSEGATIHELLESLQTELRNGPTNWLAKAVQKQQKSGDSNNNRFDEMEAEGWNE